MSPRRVERMINYYAITFEPQHNAHLSKFNLAQQSKVQYLSSDRPTSSQLLKREKCFLKSEHGSFENTVYSPVPSKITELFQVLV